MFSVVMADLFTFPSEAPQNTSTFLHVNGFGSTQLLRFKKFPTPISNQMGGDLREFGVRFSNNKICATIDLTYTSI